MKSIVIGVAGGSGSGKTTVARNICEQVGRDKVAYLSHDFYYKDASHLTLAERHKLNCDHPDAFDSVLLAQHIKKLKENSPADVPIYDYKTYIRAKETQRIEPQAVIVVEGILILADKRLRELMDVKIFVDADPDIRFIRRLQRDIKERARTPELVIMQYLKLTRPMHLEFVEPSKRYADVIIPEGGFNNVAIDMVTARINMLLAAAQ